MFGYIYIAGEIDGLHKVGYTTQPLERLINLQRQYGADITYSALYFIRDNQLRDVERATHEALGRDKRVTGEWFELSHDGANTITRILTKRYGGRMLTRDEIQALVTGCVAPCRDCGVTLALDPPVTETYKRRRIICDNCHALRVAERDAKMSQKGLTVTRERKITRNDVTRAVADKRNALRETSVTRDTEPRDRSHITPVTNTRNAWSRVTAWVRRWLNWQP